jgi:hypothetical protein
VSMCRGRGKERVGSPFRKKGGEGRARLTAATFASPVNFHNIVLVNSTRTSNSWLPDHPLSLTLSLSLSPEGGGSEGGMLGVPEHYSTLHVPYLRA